jgi:hypothetical protein
MKRTHTIQYLRPFTITATILYPADAAGFRRTHQVPTFMLSAHVHGIRTCDAAQRFAVIMLMAIAGPETLVHAIAVQL